VTRTVRLRVSRSRSKKFRASSILQKTTSPEPKSTFLRSPSSRQNTASHHSARSRMSEFP
jgi:hypothetical protein